MRRFEELDALRGIAALSVVFCHLTALWPQKDYGFRFGSTGVDLFFMISGFVILMTLEGKKSGADFLVSRFSRLYPAYRAAVILTTTAVFLQRAWVPETGTITTTRFLANLTMLQRYLGSADIDDVYWTLAIELSFYAGMLILFWLKGLRHVEAIGFASLTFVLPFRSVWMERDWAAAHGFLINWLPIVCFYPLFVAGMCFYRIKTEGGSGRRYALLALCYPAQLLLFNEGGVSRFIVTSEEYSLVLAAYFLLFLLFVRNRLHFLVNRVTLFLGTISYSLYLCHQYIGEQFLMPYLIERRGTGFWPAFCITLAAVLAIAYAINRFIERPSLRLIRDRFRWGNQT